MGSMAEPLILGIDTSCDETAAAVSSGRRILANVIASQINLHKKWGGVVPNLAKRAHLQKIKPVVNQALKQSHTQAKDLDAISVTVGPGLAPALEVGLNYARNLAKKQQKPLIAINHMEGHLLSAFCLNSKGNGPLPTEFKATNLLGLLVSGGHTQLVLVKKIGQYQLLGETLDDAAGEALDKLAKMLKLGYPGGPIIEELAKKGDPDSIPLPAPLLHSQQLNFSFSGLKTAALYTIQKNKLTKQFTYNLCANFQKAVATSLTSKLKKAIDQYSPQAVLLGGGVISNLYLRRQIRLSVKPYRLPLYLPYSPRLLTDNAAMISIAAYYHFLKKEFVQHPECLDRQPSLNFGLNV
jgi:N6-L-threonylcarbamoyladenine synthase